MLLLVLAASLTVTLLASAYMFYGKRFEVVTHIIPKGYPLHSDSVGNVTSIPGLYGFSNESAIRSKSHSLGSDAKRVPVSRSIASFVKCSF